MQIRAATSEDVQAITKLATDLFTLHQTFDNEYYAMEEHPEQYISKWVAEQVRAVTSFMLVAEIDGEVAGLIAGYIKPLYPWFITKAVGHLSFLIVQPQHRKKGIATALQEAAMSWFKTRNMTYVEVFVEEKNEIGNTAWNAFEFSPFRKFMRKKI
jgi:ribosomal protein S18 acetylase RimI-like enzyme